MATQPSMTRKELRIRFLEYIKEISPDALTYYPASGHDQLPKEILGTHNVIHLSLKSDEVDYHYFQKLGPGIKILGDMKQSPLADDSVDVIYLRYHAKKSLPDFERLLKKSGIIAIEVVNYYEEKPWKELLDMFKNYKKITLPAAIPERCQFWSAEKEETEEEKYFNSEEEMIDFVYNHKEWNGRESLLHHAVFQKIS